MCSNDTCIGTIPVFHSLVAHTHFGSYEQFGIIETFSSNEMNENVKNESQALT